MNRSINIFVDRLPKPTERITPKDHVRCLLQDLDLLEMVVIGGVKVENGEQLVTYTFVNIEEKRWKNIIRRRFIKEIKHAIKDYT